MKKYNSISYIRLIAMIMIIFDHLIGMRYPGLFVNRLISGGILKPLHIIQYFGALGVVLFYLASGFLFKSSSLKKTIKKIIDIFLICLVSTLVFYGFEKVLWLCRIDTYWKEFSLVEWLNGATLFGYINGIGDHINGTTWFLIPLFIYYLIATVMNILSKKYNEKKVYITTLLVMLLVTVLLVFLQKQGLNISISYYVIFTFVPLTGKGIRLLIDNKIELLKTIFSLMLCYGGFLCGLYFFAHQYYTEEPYLISYVYGSLLFLIFVLLEDKFKNSLIIDEINKYGLSIYLLHVLWGCQLLSFPVNSIVYCCYIVPLVLGLIIYLNHRFIELPIKSIHYKRSKNDN